MNFAALRSHIGFFPLSLRGTQSQVLVRFVFLQKVGSFLTSRTSYFHIRPESPLPILLRTLLQSHPEVRENRSRTADAGYFPPPPPSYLSTIPWPRIFSLCRRKVCSFCIGFFLHPGPAHVPRLRFPNLLASQVIFYTKFFDQLEFRT